MAMGPIGDGSLRNASRVDFHSAYPRRSSSDADTAVGKRISGLLLGHQHLTKFRRSFGLRAGLQE
jgi:hypothetical protein